MFLTLRPRLVAVLMAASYACGWAHVRPDVIIVHLIQTAAQAIETSHGY